MSITLNYGPNGTAVGGLATVTRTFSPLNFATDFSVLSEQAGQVIYTDVTAPVDRPATLRIAQSVRPNIYAGTGISEAYMAGSRKGLDSVVEVKAIFSATDSVSGAVTYYPVRLAISTNLPQAGIVTPTELDYLLNRATAALYAQGEGTTANGVNKLLRGVLKKV